MQLHVPLSSCLYRFIHVLLPWDSASLPELLMAPLTLVSSSRVSSRELHHHCNPASAQTSIDGKTIDIVIAIHCMVE